MVMPVIMGMGVCVVVAVAGDRVVILFEVDVLVVMMLDHVSGRGEQQGELTHLDDGILPIVINWRHGVFKNRGRTVSVAMIVFCLASGWYTVLDQASPTVQKQSADDIEA